MVVKREGQFTPTGVEHFHGQNNYNELPGRCSAIVHTEVT